MLSVSQNSDMFWKPTVAVQADAADFMVRLQSKVGKLHYSDGWLAKLKERDTQKEEANR